jgi:hypothetical protein
MGDARMPDSGGAGRRPSGPSLWRPRFRFQSMKNRRHVLEYMYYVFGRPGSPMPRRPQKREALRWLENTSNSQSQAMSQHEAIGGTLGGDPPDKWWSVEQEIGADGPHHEGARGLRDVSCGWRNG